MESRTKKKLGTAIGGVAAVGAAISLTAGTFSYFTDTDTGPTQTVTTGHISVENSYSHVFPDVKWAPATSYTEKYTLTNTGTVAGDLSVNLHDAGGDPELKNALQVDVASLGAISLAGAETVAPYKVAHLAPGQSKTFTITVTLPETNQNQNALKDMSASANVVATLQSTP